jgi:hypothetical protein
MTIASPAVVTLNNHGFLGGEKIQFGTSGALPTGVVAGTTYYVLSAGIATNTFRFAATAGGTAINTSGTQSGVHKIYQSRDVYVEYRVAGHGQIATQYTNRPFSMFNVSTAPLLTVNVNNNVNGSAYYAVQSINVYVEDLGGMLVWSAGAWRESGSFPSSFPAKAPGASQTASILSAGIPPGSAVIEPDASTDGLLEEDRIYYLGLAPWFGPKSVGLGYAEVCFQQGASTVGGTLTAPKIFSVYLPPGFTALSFTFDYCPLNPADTTTLPVNAEISIKEAIVLCGVTPEDMMPADTQQQNNGCSGTTLKTTVSSSSFDQTNVAANSPPGTLSTIAVNNGSSKQIPIGACLKAVRTATSGAGDITADASTMNGKYFYVVASAFNSTTGVSTISVSKSQAGTAATLAVTGTSSTWHFEWAQYTGSIACLPKAQDRISSCGSYSANADFISAKAVAGRGIGVIRQYASDRPSDTPHDPFMIACGVFTDLDFSFANFRHVSTPYFQSAIDIRDYANTVDVATTWSSFEVPIEDINGDVINWQFQSRQSGNRIWCVNAYNEPFYSNGYVFKSGIPSAAAGSNTFARWPITSYIEFLKDRMVLASDRGNQSYAQGYFYFSKLDTGSGDIQDFSYNVTTPNVFPVNTSDQSKLNGLNIYSQDLSTVGAATYLVVGKQASIFTWSGDISTAPQQIAAATGFAGPNCYCLSKFGPVYVGRDNVYLLRSASEVIPIGDNFKDVIENLNEEQLASVSTIFDKDTIKVCYQDTVNLDREIWLRLWYREGAIQKAWSGPHIRTPFIEQAQILSFDDQINVRIIRDDTEFYRSDDPGSYLNNGQNMDRLIKISNLGLQFDHFWKLITDFYMSLKVVQEETFELTLEAENGSDPLVIEIVATPSGNTRFLCQTQLKQRFEGRVMTLTLENTSNGPLSIYDLSLLFKQIRRRLLNL